MPSTDSVPAVSGETEPIIFIVELLPAPFGPRNPNASPSWTSKSIVVDGDEVVEMLGEAAGRYERIGHRAVNASSTRCSESVGARQWRAPT